MRALEMMSSASSSSSTTPSWEQEVFISFRGEDTRTGFTSHLYTALTSIGIRTFKDDKKIGMGDTIATELLTAIEKARFAVVVLSETFATSKWCLDEIAKVVDCREHGELIVIPVFYHVSPSDVRHQKNSFKDAFSNHEMDPAIPPKKLETWRDAFRKIGGISGVPVTKDRDESDVVKEIMRRILILKEKQDTLPTDGINDLVGMESRVDEVVRILSIESSEVRFVGICGMSGMGKTTLAEEVYKRINTGFKVTCFIENIKDVTKNNDSATLCNLQQKVLDKISKGNIRVESVSHGQTLLGTMLRGLKVLIVLDDVNHEDQITYLAGRREWFGPGSRVIITTTNLHLLDPRIINGTYTCEELESDDALRLFCQFAFGKGQPAHGYERLSNDIVELACGLPLALKVYGCALRDGGKDFWEGTLMKLRKSSPDEILGRLEVVFARLEEGHRKTFIYIACFLNGRIMNFVEEILTSLNLNPRCEIQELINMFLITINHDDSIWVHDLLRQMCWEFLRKKSDSLNGKHIAIKWRKDIENILSSEPKGTRTIEIINQEPFKFDGADFFDDHNCFSKMMKLKFLRISKIDFHEGLHYLSNDLRIVEWYGCSLKSLPSSFKPRNLFELEMCYSQLERLWEKDLNLPNLRSINLSFSEDLTKIPELTSTPNLEKLNLEGCTKLAELHESVLLHRNIQYMNLKGCTSLQSLGRRTMEMEALEALFLSGCLKLECIPEFGENMKCLDHLYVDGTSIKKLPDNLGEMYFLRKIDASETSIEVLPSSIHHLYKLRLLHLRKCKQLSFKAGGFLYMNPNTLSSCLRELDLSDCNLSEVPAGIGLLYCLINLDLCGNDFVSLPASIALLSKLRMLCLNNCKRLQSLPKLSLVNDDTDYGPRDRFNYYVSKGGYYHAHAASNYTSPTVSCLGCPKLAENVLNSYLQIQTNYLREAVFEIVQVGREMPSGFKMHKSGKTLKVDGMWTGVAICAVIYACNDNVYMDAKYTVTAHIDDGEAHWKIPIPVSLLLMDVGRENQVIFYWTGADDDPQRPVDSRQKNLGITVTVEPKDGNLKVDEFRVRIIRHEDIQQSKGLEDSKRGAVQRMFRATLYLPTDLQWYLHACEADTDLHSCHSTIHDLTSRIIRFILDNGTQQYSLDGLHRIIKSLMEINQEVLSECMEEQMQRQFLPLVCDYCRIIYGTYELYSDFVQLLKDVSDNWLAVKLVLEQIVAKSRAMDYYSGVEMLLQKLNDLEAAESVGFSGKFIIKFAYICKQTVAFSSHLDEEIQRNANVKSLKLLAKVSSVTIAGVFSVMAIYIGDSELMQEMKDITSYLSWLNVIQSFSRKSDKWLVGRTQPIRPSCDDWELKISEICGSIDLLDELKKKVSGSGHLTTEEGMIVINKLEKKIDELSVIIEDMSDHACNYRLEMENTSTKLFADGNLRMSKFGVRLVCYRCYWEPELDEDSLRDAIEILYRATSSSQHADLPWYIPRFSMCGPLIALDSNIIIQLFLDHGKQQNSLVGISKIFECMHSVNIEAIESTSHESIEDWLIPLCEKYNDLNYETVQLYGKFTDFLKDIADSWRKVKSELEKFVVKSRDRAGDYNYQEMQQQDINLRADESIETSYPQFVTSFFTICEATIDFLRPFNDKLQSNKNMESVNVLATVSRVTIVGVFSFMATYMDDFRLLQSLKNGPSNYELLDLIESLPRKGGEWFSESGELTRTSYGGDESHIWDFYGDAIVDELKKKMTLYSCFTREVEEEMKIVIDKLEKNLHNFSQTITEMSRCASRYLADYYCDDDTDAGNCS